MNNNGESTKIRMSRSQALEWVKLAIEREKYDVAIEILNDLIEQEKTYDESTKS